MLRIFAFLALTASVLTAQSATFDVVTIHANKSPENRGGVSVSRNNGGTKINIRNTSLRMILRRVYGVRDHQIAGPDWIGAEKYDVVATTSADLPADQIWAMMQAVLTERFHMVVRHENKVLPVYALVAAKGGAKVTPSEPGGESGVWDSSRFPNSKLTAKKIRMDAFADSLSGQVDRPVIDATGLAGVFDFTLEFVKDDAGSGPSLFHALQEQLGLKLEARKAPVDLLVIDRADRLPTEN